jgi:two-component system, OmpR family, sensor histidine kinase KdpD
MIEETSARPGTQDLLHASAGGRSVGAVGLAGCDLSRESLEAMGSSVAISIERAHTVEKLSRSEAASESDRPRFVLLDSVTHEFHHALDINKSSGRNIDV